MRHSCSASSFVCTCAQHVMACLTGQSSWVHHTMQALMPIVLLLSHVFLFIECILVDCVAVERTGRAAETLDARDARPRSPARPLPTYCYLTHAFPIKKCFTFTYCMVALTTGSCMYSLKCVCVQLSPLPPSPSPSLPLPPPPSPSLRFNTQMQCGVHSSRILTLGFCYNVHC